MSVAPVTLKVHVLPDILASQVAAGEVVERPASVVKELVENSIDAGARKIEVLVRRGGISLIRVTDNGEGMVREDALMALERHATSKLRTKGDLARIVTLGFRGEALPSIASVSKFRLSTRPKGALEGTQITVDGGKLGEVTDSGEAPGTQMEVRSLFYNVPARRKFLRTEATEFGHIEHQVRLQAIAHPEVAFTLVHNDRVCFQLPPATEMLERVRGLVGDEAASNLIEVTGGSGGLEIGGFIGRPGFSRANRSQQLIFINRRPVESPVFNYALREGYRGVLMKGQYAVCYLFIEMDPAEVDFNVHPAKREIRFRNGNYVRDALTSAVSEALTQSTHLRTGAPAPQESMPENVRPPGILPLPRVVLPDRQVGLDMEDPEPRVEPKPLAEPQTVPPEPAPQKKKAARPEFEFLGVVDKGYTIFRGDEGIVLMDQRAAHERVLYEKLSADIRASAVASQSLLVPVTTELPPKDFAFLKQNLDVVRRAGLGIEEFGTNTVKIDSLPAFMRERDMAAFVDSVIEELKHTSSAISSLRLGDHDVVATVCRMAVREDDVLQESQLIRLVDDLFDCEMPYCCPEGKPTLVQIGYTEIDQKFAKSR